MLKQITLSFLALAFAALSMSVAVASEKAATPVNAILAETGLPADALTNLDEFVTLTPKKYKEMTGKKLSLKETIVLKLAQKKIKKQIRKANNGQKEGDEEFPKGLFIVCAIFLPIAAVIFMGIMDDWKGNTWWTAAILYALCYLPGLIYTLTKVKNYYPSK